MTHKINWRVHARLVRAEKRILEILTTGEKPLYEITRRTRSIDVQTRQTILASLVASGHVLERLEQSAGRPKTLYRISEKFLKQESGSCYGQTIWVAPW